MEDRTSLDGADLEEHVRRQITAETTDLTAFNPSYTRLKAGYRANAANWFSRGVSGYERSAQLGFGKTFSETTAEEKLAIYRHVVEEDPTYQDLPSNIVENLNNITVGEADLGD